MFLAGCNEINNNSTPFELTQVEQRAYSELQKDLSEQHIKDLLPISNLLLPLVNQKFFVIAGLINASNTSSTDFLMSI